MSAFSMFLAAMAALGALYYALSTIALARHFRHPTPGTHDPIPRVQHPTPKVSVLKPICGLEPDLRYNLLTFCSQDYPDYEVLFGVLDADDPAAALVQELAENCANASDHVGSTITGSNNKVRILHELATHATGEIILVADADTRATPDFLARMAAQFADPKVGAATCFYKGVKARTIADALEALHMTCIFAPGIAAAEALGGIGFALGAATAIRRSVLEEIGGFAPMADYLADDFQLGRRTAQAGYKVALGDYVIEIALSGEDLAGVLARELRWCRTTKVSNPYGHFGLVVTFGVAYATFFWAATGFTVLGWLVMGAMLCLRTATAWLSARAFLGDREFAGRLYLLPTRDLLSLGVWVAGYLSRCVTWRGRKLRLWADGKMTPVL